MSDSIGKVGNTSAVSSTAAASPAQLNSLAEVQYYNVKAIGANRVMGNGGDQGIPLGASLSAYAGDSSTPAPSSSTRALLEGGSAGFPTADPAASNTAPPASTGDPWLQSTPPSAPPANGQAQDPWLQSTPPAAPSPSYAAPPASPSYAPPPPAAAPLYTPPPQTSATVPGAPTISKPTAPPTPVMPTPPADTSGMVNPYSQPQFTAAPPPSSAPDPFLQQSNVSSPGDPWAQPPPSAAAAPSASYAPPPQAQTQPTLQSRSVASIDASSPSTPTSMSTPPDKKVDKKEDWHLDSVPQNERDFELDSPLDNRPQDTWAPQANRSKEFAALDTTKLTSPEEALAEWRSQQEATASAAQTTASIPPPEQAAAPAPVSPLAQVPAAPVAQAVAPIAPQASAALPTSPQSDAFSAPTPFATSTPAQAQVPSGPGNPWLAPGGGPAAASPAVSPMTGPSAPVDLSAGGYNNPNLSGRPSVLTAGPGGAPSTIPPSAMYSTPTSSHIDQSIPYPNVYPYMTPQGVQGTQGQPMQMSPQSQMSPQNVAPMGPQGMYQTRYNAMASNVTPATSLFEDKSDEDDDDEDKSADIMGASPVLMNAQAEQAAQQAGYGYPTAPAGPPPGVVGPALLKRLGNYGA